MTNNHTTPSAQPVSEEEQKKWLLLRREEECCFNGHKCFQCIAAKYRREKLDLQSRLSQKEEENQKLQKRVEELEEAGEELLEVATLRGDNELPSPPDDPKLWTARMQEAWDIFEQTLSTSSHD